MTTPASLTASEKSVGGHAARTYLKANMPGWELAMVPQAKIDGLVAAIVGAIDAARDAPPAPTTTPAPAPPTT
jgi:hypothetical protein